VPRKDDTTATFSLRLERAKWAECFFRLMDGILNMGLAVCDSDPWSAPAHAMQRSHGCEIKNWPADTVARVERLRPGGGSTRRRRCAWWTVPRYSSDGKHLYDTIRFMVQQCQ
jgi:hypothetical protein